MRRGRRQRGAFVVFSDENRPAQWAFTAMPALTAVRRSDRIAPMDGANAVMIAGDTARGLEGDLFSMHPIEELLILAWAAKYVMCWRHASRSVATLFSH